MMTAKEILSPYGTPYTDELRSVSGEMSVLDVLPRLLDAPGRRLGVTEQGRPIGVIDQTSMLEGLGRMIASRDDSCLVTVECRPEDFSASRLAHAVEDSDAHLVDMLSTPAPDGMLNVTLRVRRADPSPTVRSLERYGYNVAAASGSSYQDSDTAIERLLELNTLLNV